MNIKIDFIHRPRRTAQRYAHGTLDAIPFVAREFRDWQGAHNRWVVVNWDGPEKPTHGQRIAIGQAIHEQVRILESAT